MKGRSHRAPHRCYGRSGHWSTSAPPSTRRPDGYRLYSPVHIAIPGSSATRWSWRNSTCPTPVGFGGLVLLKAVDDRLHLTDAVARCLTEFRGNLGKVAHSVLDLVQQRVFGLAAGYLDGDDAARLADDPLHKLVLDHKPLTGPALGSQPSLSRFKNGISRQDLDHVGQCLARTVIAHHRRRLPPARPAVTINLNPTDNPTPWPAGLILFNGHYDTACCLPLVATLTFNNSRSSTWRGSSSARATHPPPAGRSAGCAGWSGCCEQYVDVLARSIRTSQRSRPIARGWRARCPGAGRSPPGTGAARRRRSGSRPAAGSTRCRSGR